MAATAQQKPSVDVGCVKQPQDIAADKHKCL